MQRLIDPLEDPEVIAETIGNREVRIQRLRHRAGTHAVQAMLYAAAASDLERLQGRTRRPVQRLTSRTFGIAQKLRKLGWSYRRIASVIGVSHTTLYRAVQSGRATTTI